MQSGVCPLRLQMHRILAGSSVDRTPGFEGVIRANELGRQMMGSNIELAKLL